MTEEYFFRFKIRRIAIGMTRTSAWGKRSSPNGTLIAIGHFSIYLYSTQE